MSGDKGLETLQVWQKAMTFVKDIYQTALPCLPNEEKWALASQLRRSAQSIPANIAEGYGRYYYQETIRFCYIARGSLEETYTHLRLAHELDYLPEEPYRNLNQQIQELHRMLNGYIAYLKRTKRGANEPGAGSAFKEAPLPYDINSE
ncbi:MAG: four helix bundle protein [Chloroflexi bacterium]|nr:four helix bundle protein [Chloroflexota bacterium]